MSLLNLIGEGSGIPYRPRLRFLFGPDNRISVNAAIFLQQVVYLYVRSGSRPFYKFLNPCDHDWYVEGDSWAESLQMSSKEVSGARGQVARKVGSGDSKADLSKVYPILYWTDSSRVTWYQVCEVPLRKLLSDLYGSSPIVPDETSEYDLSFLSDSYRLSYGDAIASAAKEFDISSADALIRRFFDRRKAIPHVINPWVRNLSTLLDTDKKKWIEIVAAIVIGGSRANADPIGYANSLLIGGFNNEAAFKAKR